MCLPSCAHPGRPLCTLCTPVCRITDATPSWTAANRGGHAHRHTHTYTAAHSQLSTSKYAFYMRARAARSAHQRDHHTTSSVWHQLTPKRESFGPCFYSFINHRKIMVENIDVFTNYISNSENYRDIIQINLVINDSYKNTCLNIMMHFCWLTGNLRKRGHNLT